MISEATEYLKKKYPNISIKGYRFLERDGRTVILIRCSLDKKTLRFVYGDDFPEPKKIGSAARKRIGASYTPKKYRRKKKKGLP
tara:strand:- start:865 stop:1116 length:252 start_codon:yes stop_codon:yes gene_type:complete